MAVPALFIAVLVAGYLVGSLPIANAVARRHGVRDLREVGDRNPGYWNARTQLGTREALPVLAGDAAKGVVAAGVGVAAGPWWLGAAGAAAAMAGHAWPVFARWHGGRGVATFVGAAIVLSPAAAALAGAVALGVLVATRRTEWAVRVGVFGYPAAQLVVDGPVRTATTGALMTIIGVRFAQASWRDRCVDRATSRAA